MKCLALIVAIVAISFHYSESLGRKGQFQKSDDDFIQKILRKFAKNGASRLTTYKYINCGNPQTDIADLSKLVFGPDPIALPGDITVEFDLALRHTLHSPLMTTVDLRKKTGDTWVKIPCVADIGSCTYSDLCQFLALIPACPQPFIDNGIPCQCPLGQGKYSLPQTSFEVDIAIFPSGDYHGIVNITSNNEHIGCADLMFSFS